MNLPDTSPLTPHETHQPDILYACLGMEIKTLYLTFASILTLSHQIGQAEIMSYDPLLSLHDHESEEERGIT